MNAYIALEKYIVKEEKDFGVGVSVSLDEDIAKYESTRKKNVKSYNNWLMINIPSSNFFLDISKPVNEQSSEVSSILMNKEFIMSLFIHETRIILNEMEGKNSGKVVREEVNKILEDFVKEKYESIFKLNSGFDLFSFVNSKCINQDKRKSSALLYNHGIKGIIYKDDSDERYLLFNAKNDIEILQYRNAELKDSKLII